jgi:hypothetical protein
VNKRSKQISSPNEAPKSVVNEARGHGMPGVEALAGSRKNTSPPNK